jgi:hypothetical protein
MENNEEIVVSTPFPWFIYQSENWLFVFFSARVVTEGTSKCDNSFSQQTSFDRERQNARAQNLIKGYFQQQKIPLTVTRNTDPGLFYCRKC